VDGICAYDLRFVLFFVTGGYLNLARTAPQVERVHELLKYYRSWGFGEEDYRRLSIRETAAIVITDHGAFIKKVFS
jgi:hypothetical protein